MVLRHLSSHLSLGIAFGLASLLCVLSLPAASTKALCSSQTPTGSSDPQGQSQPKPIPANRAEMLRALEALKTREPRLPLEASGRGGVGNGAARRTYLPSAWHAADFRGDDVMTLDRNFKVRLFWIVARANNCHYCLGHQEIKLQSGGMVSAELAALDNAWDLFPPAEQAAFAFAKKVTLEPHAIAAADIEALRPFYDDAQIVEIAHVVSNFNSVNRWTDGLGLPQEAGRVFDDPQALPPAEAPSLVIPAGEVARPALCTAAEARAAMANARTRQARVAIPRDLPASLAEFNELPQQWLRACSLFPTLARTQAAAAQSMADDGTLPATLKAQAAWVSARQNRAWYALDVATRRLLDLGWKDDDIFQLDDVSTCSKLSDAERKALQLVRKLTVAPQFITDEDIEQLRGPWTDHQVAELVFITCAANQFDRFTEALGLPLDRMD